MEDIYVLSAGQQPTNFRKCYILLYASANHLLQGEPMASVLIDFQTVVILKVDG